MTTLVYPIEQLTEHVCGKTLELVQELGSGLERVALENAAMPGIERLIKTIDADPLPLFALSLYVQVRALHHALFPEDAVQMVRERAVNALAHGLTNPDLAGPMAAWLDTLDQGWTKLAAGSGDAWIEPIVEAIEKHYAEEAEAGEVWTRLFYLTLITEAYRTNAAAMAEIIKQSPELVPVPTA